MKSRRPSTKVARNERRKAIANALNALAIAGVAGAVLQPLVGGKFNWALALVAAGAFIVLHGLVYYVLGRLED